MRFTALLAVLLGCSAGPSVVVPEPPAVVDVPVVVVEPVEPVDTTPEPVDDEAVVVHEPVEAPEPANDSETPDSCQCGDDCNCVDCQCPGCPHQAVKDSLTTHPPLVITSAISGCPPCERFKRDALPRLQAAGWVEGKDYAVRLVPLGSETVPSFAYRGELFTQGYGGWSDWRAKLVTAMGEPERVTHEAQRHDAAKPVQAHHLSPGLHSHQCPCGNRWTHDANAITDFYSAHTCRRCGRLVTVHAD